MKGALLIHLQRCQPCPCPRFSALPSLRVLARTRLLCKTADMRKMFCIVLSAAIMTVSSLPLLPASAMAERPHTAKCPLCHMDASGQRPGEFLSPSQENQRHGLTAAMFHCRIECCWHHDVDGLPHLLAPHALSRIVLAAHSVIALTMIPSDHGLKARPFPFPTPPPRFV